MAPYQKVLPAMAHPSFARNLFSGLLSICLLAAMGGGLFFGGKASIAQKEKRQEANDSWRKFTDSHCLEKFNRRSDWLMVYCDDGNAYVVAFTGRNGLHDILPKNLPSLLRGDYQRVPLPEKVPTGVFEGMKDTDFMERRIVGGRTRLYSVGQSWVKPPKPAQEM